MELKWLSRRAYRVIQIVDRTLTPTLMEVLNLVSLQKKKLVESSEKEEMEVLMLSTHIPNTTI